MKISDWKPYPGGRLMKNVDGYCVIVPQDFQGTIPISCPVCSVLMRSKDDETSWDKFQCCANCAQEWAESQPNKWNEGWRPEICDINDMMERRAMFTVQFDL
jgi:hypothetical protein